MFDEIIGMPLHPLIIHAPVFGIPLALLLAGLFAFPRTREWARWPLLLTVLGSTAATFAAKESGEALQASLGIQPGNPVGDLIEQHQTLADQLFYIMLGYAVVAIATVFLVKRSAAGTERDVPGAGGVRQRPLATVLQLVLVLAGIVAMVWVIRVGDVGARAVWNPNSTGLFPF